MKQIIIDYSNYSNSSQEQLDSESRMLLNAKGFTHTVPLHETPFSSWSIDSALMRREDIPSLRGWCIAQISGDWLRSGELIGFTNEDDALRFKMWWC